MATRGQIREWAHGTLRSYPGDGPSDGFAIQALFGPSRQSSSFYLTPAEAREMAAALIAAADDCDAVPDTGREDESAFLDAAASPEAK